MGKWRDLAAQLREEDCGGDNRDNRVNSDNRSASAPVSAPFAPIDPIAPIALAPLPEPIRKGLALLPTLAAPRLAQPEVWPSIVADALRLEREGWAQSALALGWHPLHLWGAHLHHPGLAVWLEGRRIVLLDAETCIVADSPDRRSVFTLRDFAPGTCFLWDYGRGRG